MTIGSSNRTGLYRVKESTWGTTPASPTLIETRYTGEAINQDLENIVSSEIRSDRQVTDLVQVSQSSGGTFDFEMSFAAFDDLMEGAMESTFGTAVGVSAATTISFDNGAGTIADSANGFGNVVVGQWIKVQGASNSTNNTVYRVTAAAAGSLTVDPAPAVTESAGASVTVTGQMMRNGTTPAFFTLQKRFNDTTAVTYHNFTGMYVDTMSLNFEVGSILNGSFGFLGKAGSMTETQISGASDQAAATGTVMNSVSNLKNIEIDNTDLTVCIQSMSVEVANGLREQRGIGSLDACGIGNGQLNVTGSISIFFESKAEFDKYTGSSEFSLSFRAEDASGQAYVFSFPRVKYETMSVNSGGTDTDLTLEGTWRAIRDSSTNSMIQVDKLALS